MIQVKEIRAALASLRDGNLTLWEFHDWLEKASFNMHQASSRPAMNLVGEIEIVFAEHDRGMISESDVLAEILKHISAPAQESPQTGVAEKS